MAWPLLLSGLALSWLGFGPDSDKPWSWLDWLSGFLALADLVLAGLSGHGLLLIMPDLALACLWFWLRQAWL